MKVVKLELDTEERDVLVPELESVIRELGGVIASGVRKDLRDEMKKERDMLRDILERLKTAA
jgi:hypothetical protein